MDVSKNSGTPKSSILIGFSIINHPFWGTPIFGNTHMFLKSLLDILVIQSNYNIRRISLTLLFFCYDFCYFTDFTLPREHAGALFEQIPNPSN